MKKSVWPSVVRGSIAAPPSKSIVQRAIAIASLAGGVSVVEGAGTSDDVLSATRVCMALGADIKTQHDKLVIRGGIKAPGKALDCGESGLAIRMFSCIAASFDKEVVLTGTGTLKNRPLRSVETSLTALGVYCKTHNGRLPVMVRGPLPGGKATIDASLSSQVLTGILITAAFAKKDTYINVRNIVSKPYVDITVDIMRTFGVEVLNKNHESFVIKSGQVYKPANIVVEGDWSAAAFLLVAGAIGGSVCVKNLKTDSYQADRKVLQALRSAGAIIEQTDIGINIQKNYLKAFEFDATHCPDLFPPLVVLAANCKGESRIHGVDRLHAKESNRALVLQQIFTQFGIQVSTEGNTMVINGGVIKPATVSSNGDHRIVMASAIAALKAQGPIIIKGTEAVRKSYPGFFSDLKRITSPK